MKQAKKIFTRILMNNWGGIDHQVLCLNEYVNLFSGKSGSGKSSVMDAMQVVLYGSVGNDFLNRAADDSANKRSVLSYLRGGKKMVRRTVRIRIFMPILSWRYRIQGGKVTHVSEQFSKSEKMIWT